MAIVIGFIKIQGKLTKSAVDHIKDRVYLRIAFTSISSCVSVNVIDHYNQLCLK